MTGRRVLLSAVALVVATSVGITPAVRRVEAAASAGLANPARWRPWLLASSDQFRLPAPPAVDSDRTRRELRELRRLQRDLTRAQRRSIDRWNRQAAVVPWTKIALAMIAKHRPRPPFAARALALLHTGMYDALVATFDSKGAYNRPRPSRLDTRIRPLLPQRGSSYPPEQAVIAGVAEEILAHLFPSERSDTFTAAADEAVMSRLYAGVNYRSDVVRGRALGHDVAALFIERALNDGSSNTGFSNPRPEGEQYWEATPPGFEPPTGGPVGTWRPWLTEAAADARIGSGLPPPYSYASAEFMAELDEVFDVQANLTSQQQNIAVFWDDGPGSFTPAGHWFDITLDAVRNRDLGTKPVTRMLAYLGVVEADAATAFFEAKYAYWSIRPVTAIRRLCEGGTRLCSKSELESNPNLATYPDWLPYIVTPPFPAYPGGHSTFSGAAAKLLGHFLPDLAEELTGQAEEAAVSRLFGGIHFRSDNDGGLLLGRHVAQLAIERAESDGAE